jgi:hypothetical protein
MNQASVLYHQAVNFAEQADIARIKQLPIDYKALYAQASILEKDAAFMMSAQEQYPMPRTLMLKSAAALAFKAGNYSESAKIIALCRAENPPNGVIEKLNLLEQDIQTATANFLEKPLNIIGTFTSVNVDEKEIKIREVDSQNIFAFVVPADSFRKIAKSYLLEVVSVVGKFNKMGVLTLEKISLTNIS